MKSPKRARQQAYARIERAFYAMCSDIPVPVMKIQNVFVEGRRLVDAGADDTQLRAGVLAFVQNLVKENA